MDMCSNSTDQVVSAILDKSRGSECSGYKSIDVHKDIDVHIDLGHLLVSDQNPIEQTELRGNREAYLLKQARDDVQLLVNRLWELPSERVEDVIIVRLPAPVTRIPREKPIPPPRQMTKWEEFAQIKGIQNKKKSRMVFDKQSKEYKPRWGYKRANDDTKEWLIPVPDNADPNEDQFEKRMKAKKERVSKNELQRLRNVARGMKGKVPGVGLTPTINPDKDHLNRALVAAKTSNASMGMFTEALPKENETVKGIGKKRKFMPNTNELGKEKQRALDILSNINSAKSVVDKDRAAKVHATVMKQTPSRNETGMSINLADTSKKFGRGKPTDRDRNSNSRKSNNKSFKSRGGGQTSSFHRRG